MQKKRGQITIFIIVGIIVMFSIALFIYFRNVSLPKPAEQEIVPGEYLPVQNYVQSCVDILAQRGIVLLGLQGGYVALPERIDRDPLGYIALIPEGNIKLPYWYHRGEARVPTIKDMETQIGNFVSRNLLGCLQNFTPLLQQFNITPVSDITSLTTIGEEDVTVETSYQLAVSLHERSGEEQETVTMTRFLSRIPVRLKRMHQLAVDLVRAEDNGLFFENITIDLMALGTGEPPEGIPFSDMVFTCGMLQWKKSGVEENIKNRLFYNLPRISFANTKTEPPDDLYAANNLYLRMTDKKYDDLRAGVYYSKDWNFLLNARPSNGDTMSAKYGKGNEKYLPYLCINIYHFTYDIEYPVQLTIRDEAAFSGSGYDFSFALPVLIKNNEGNRAETGFNLFEVPQGNDQGYCDHRREQEAVIYAKDTLTFDDVKGINVTFTCLDTYTCPLGQTQSDGQVYRLRARLPDFCVPGALEAEGAGYIKTKQDATSGLTTTIMLTPKKSFRFEVMKKPLVREAGGGAEQDERFAQPKALDAGEQAFISITTDAFPNFVQYKQFRQFPPDAPEGEGQESEPEDIIIELARGDITYHLDLFVVDENNNFLGGYRGNWTPSLGDIENYNTVTLYAMQKSPPAVSEDAQALLFTQLASPKMQEQLQPTFS